MKINLLFRVHNLIHRNFQPNPPQSPRKKLKICFAIPHSLAKRSQPLKFPLHPQLLRGKNPFRKTKMLFCMRFCPNSFILSPIISTGIVEPWKNLICNKFKAQKIAFPFKRPFHDYKCQPKPLINSSKIRINVNLWIKILHPICAEMEKELFDLDSCELWLVRNVLGWRQLNKYKQNFRLIRPR